MAATDMSADSLDSSLVCLKIGESTFERIVHPLINCPEYGSEDHRQQEEPDERGRGEAPSRAKCTEDAASWKDPLDTYTKMLPAVHPLAPASPSSTDPSSSCAGRVIMDANPSSSCAGRVIMDANKNGAKCDKCDASNSSKTNQTNSNTEQFNRAYVNMTDSTRSTDRTGDANNNLSKGWSTSTQELSRTVDKILRACGGVSEGDRRGDLSYMGVSDALGEMLLQHGEFPATPLATPTPRYLSTPLDAACRYLSTPLDAACRYLSTPLDAACKKRHQREETSAAFQQNSLFTSSVGNSFAQHSNWQQTAPGSLPSMLSWGGSEAEGASGVLSSSLGLAACAGGASSSSLGLGVCRGLSSSLGSTTSLGNSYIPLGEAHILPQHQVKVHTSRMISPEMPPAHYQECRGAATTCVHHPAQHSITPARQLLPTVDHMPHSDQGSAGRGKVSPRRALIQDVVLRDSIRAFRSHPLFPLLRDLTITDYYYDKASFNVGLLLAFLPSSTEELVAIYLSKHPEAARAFRNPRTSAETRAVDAVALDAVAYAHASLLKTIANQSVKLSTAVEVETAEAEVAVEVMCQRFMKIVRSSTPLHLLDALHTSMPQQQSHPHQHRHFAGSTAVAAKKNGPGESFQQLEEKLASFSPIPPSYLGDDFVASFSLSEPRRRSNHSKEAINDVLGVPLSEEEIKTSLSRPFKGLKHKKDPITSSGYFQGDIMVTSEDHLYQILLGDSEDQLSAVRNPQKLWPEARIPYVISSAFSSWERAVVAGAVAEFHNNTCIRFVEKVTHADYVHILKGQGCSSAVGRSGGPQVVSLGAGCLQHGVVLHELMHAAGFWHEQSRHDRDQYVTINWGNIMQGQEYNFEKKSNTITTDLGLAYDYASVMHYDAFAFARSYAAPTILPKQSGVNIGQRTGFSELDVRGINLLYKCGSGSVEPTPTPTPAPESCEDRYEQCGTWAASGLCFTNYAYMDANCKMSCNVCDPQSCRDQNDYCSVWASVGECQRNPGYMLVFCAHACGRC